MLVRLAGLLSVCWDLGTFVTCNKNQLQDYMTTAASVVSRDPGIAVLGSQLTGLKFFHIITFAGSAQPIKAARLQRVISIPCTSHQLPAIIKLYRAAHTFFASKSRLLRSPAVHCISHQLGWLISCSTRLKVISAHRSSPANRASLAHIIRP